MTQQNISDAVASLVKERDELKNESTTLAFKVATLEQSLAHYIQRCRQAETERDRFLLVANVVTTHFEDVKSLIVTTIAKAEDQIRSYKPITPEPLADSLEKDLQEVIRGIERINPPSVEAQTPHEKPPAFLTRPFPPRTRAVPS